MPRTCEARFLVKKRHRDKLWKIVSDILRSILIHVDWYPHGQARVHHVDPKDCPLPCTKNSGCHTAVKGESCYSAVKWVREPGRSGEANTAQVVTLWGQEEWYQTAPHLAGDPKGIPGAQMKPLGQGWNVKVCILSLANLESLRYPGLTKESSLYDFQVGWFFKNMAASSIPLRRETVQIFQESVKLIEHWWKLMKKGGNRTKDQQIRWKSDWSCWGIPCHRLRIQHWLVVSSF